MSERRLGERLVFVGGSPRSGTTLVQNILDSHPEISGGPEFDRIPEVVRLRGKLRASVRSGRISAFCSEGDVDREIGLLIERLLLPYADARNARLMSEKTPWNVLAFRELSQIFPEARFVFCIRDPRAVAASMLEVGRRAREKGGSSPAFTRSLGSAVKTIRATNRAGFEAASELGGRTLTVSYENLVDDSERESIRLCDFLGAPWSEEMLRPAEKEHDGAKVLDGVWYDQAMYRSNPDPARAEKWKRQLTREQVVMICEAFERDKELSALGYDLSAPPMPPLRRAVFRARRAPVLLLESGSPFAISLAKRSALLRRVGAKLVSLARETRTPHA